MTFAVPQHPAPGGSGVCPSCRHLTHDIDLTDTHGITACTAINCGWFISWHYTTEQDPT